MITKLIFAIYIKTNIIAYRYNLYQYLQGEEYMAGYCLKQLPADVFKFVIAEQGKIKTEKGVNQYSFERVIIKLLREHPNFAAFKIKLEQLKQ